MAQRSEIDAHLTAGLPVGRSQDYRPNGPRIEGRAKLRRGVSGVAASLADTLGLHHPFTVIDYPA
jgi:hypothetical protein